MVLMIMRAPADGAKLEEMSKRTPNPFEQVRDKATATGGIRRHRVFATDTEVIVVDEWDSPEQFQKFMSETQELGQVFAEVGLTGQPDIMFAREIDLGDQVG